LPGGPEIDAAVGPGDSGDTVRAVTLQIGGQTVTGVLNGTEFTLTSFPTSFTAPFNVTFVFRNTTISSIEDLKASCATPLGANEIQSPPTFSALLMLNPLASDVILTQLQDAHIDLGLSSIVNPVTVTALTFSDPSLQGGLSPFLQTDAGLSGGVEDVVEPDAWDALCAAATLEKSPIASLAITGTAGGQPYAGTVTFSPLTFASP
jgi:hypothetical protein